MATIYRCDRCQHDFNKNDLVTVRMPDGEHPHDGKSMTKLVDFCNECLHEEVIHLKGEWA